MPMVERSPLDISILWHTRTCYPAAFHLQPHHNASPVDGLEPPILPLAGEIREGERYNREEGMGGAYFAMGPLYGPVDDKRVVRPDFGKEGIVLVRVCAHPPPRVSTRARDARRSPTARISPTAQELGIQALHQGQLLHAPAADPWSGRCGPSYPAASIPRRPPCAASPHTPLGAAEALTPSIVLSFPSFEASRPPTASACTPFPSRSLPGHHHHCNNQRPPPCSTRRCEP